MGTQVKLFGDQDLLLGLLPQPVLGVTVGLLCQTHVWRVFVPFVFQLLYIGLIRSGVFGSLDKERTRTTGASLTRCIQRAPVLLVPNESPSGYIAGQAAI